MRKPMMIELGVAAVAITAVAGIAACGTAQSSTPASATATTTDVAAITGTTTATTTTISQADAERIAVATVPGGRVTETRLDTDRGRAVWNVHLSAPNGKVEIKVDVQTGAVRRDDDNGLPSTTSSRSDDGSGHG